MNALPTIFVAEVLRRIRMRSFWVITLIGVLGVAFVIEFPLMLGRQIHHAQRLVVVAEPALAGPARAVLAKDFTVVATAAPGPSAPDLAFLREHGNADAAVVLRRGAAGIEVTAYAKDLNVLKSETLRADLRPLNVAVAMNVPERRIERSLQFPYAVRGVGTKYADVESARAAAGIGLAAAMLLYLSMLMTSQMVMSAVAEEKTSRIAELLVAAVDPVTLLAGKVLAVAAIGLGQMMLWMATAGVLLQRAGAGPAAPPPPPVSGAEVLALLAFFVLGYLEYATLFAAGASLISRTEDLGTVTGPVVLPVAAAFVLSTYALSFPEGPLVVAASFVPLLSPLVMFARIAVSVVPPWQLALTFTLNVVAVAAITVAAGRVYRVGMLLYGRPPKLGQIIAALRG
ncbi:MAG TPA: ABC transporter permease [Candidatus Dormibacteraeota bacterium]|nr:ABC transporter permease [Candidatus Dormibacteraeota bacterium]